MNHISASTAFIYNNVDFNGSAGAKLSLRVALAAEAAPELPPGTVISATIIPAATMRVYGAGTGAGGGYKTLTAGQETEIPVGGGGILDKLLFLADGAGATTATITLYAVPQP
jgi:hypothetical protein